MLNELNNSPKLALLIFTLFALNFSCGGDGVDAFGNQSQNDRFKLPTPEQLMGTWRFSALGNNIGCFSNIHLACAVQEFNFTVGRGDYCADGNYRFSVASNIAEVSIPAELTPIWDWPQCDRLSFIYHTYIGLENGDVSWDPISGIMRIRMKSWHEELCPSDEAGDLGNIWWWGNPWGPILAEGYVEVKFAWNTTTRRFYFLEGDCELATRGQMAWYYAGRGEFNEGSLYRRY